MIIQLRSNQTDPDFSRCLFVVTLCEQVPVLSPLKSLHSNRARQDVVIVDRHSAQQRLERQRGLCSLLSAPSWPAGHANNTLNFLKRHLNQHCLHVGGLREEPLPDLSLGQ